MSRTTQSRKEDKEKGNNAERLFRITMEGLGKEVKKSTYTQDLKHHVDFIIDGETYDVKSEKYRCKNDPSTERVFWAEKIGVTGYPGWLLAEELDYIAYIDAGYFKIVKREDLKKFIFENIKSDKVLTKIEYMHWYNRKDEYDVITYCYPRDIEHLVINKFKIKEPC